MSGFPGQTKSRLVLHLLATWRHCFWSAIFLTSKSNHSRAFMTGWRRGTVKEYKQEPHTHLQIKPPIFVRTNYASEVSYAILLCSNRVYIIILHLANHLHTSFLNSSLLLQNFWITPAFWNIFCEWTIMRFPVAVHQTCLCNIWNGEVWPGHISWVWWHCSFTLEIQKQDSVAMYFRTDVLLQILKTHFPFPPISKQFIITTRVRYFMIILHLIKLDQLPKRYITAQTEKGMKTGLCP